MSAMDQTVSHAVPPREGAHVPRDREGLFQEFEVCRDYLRQVASRNLAADLRPKADVSDVINDVYVEAHQDYSQFLGRSSGELRAWLRAILMNNIRNLVRRYRSSGRRRLSLEVRIDRSSSPVALADDLTSPSQGAMAREERSLVWKALGRLKERDCRVILLKHFEGLTFEEIGKQLGGISKVAAHKAYAKAEERLEREIRILRAQ